MYVLTHIKPSGYTHTNPAKLHLCLQNVLSVPFEVYELANLKAQPLSQQVVTFDHTLTYFFAFSPVNFFVGI